MNALSFSRDDRRRLILLVGATALAGFFPVTMLILIAEFGRDISMVGVVAAAALVVAYAYVTDQLAAKILAISTQIMTDIRMGVVEAIDTRPLIDLQEGATAELEHAAASGARVVFETIHEATREMLLLSIAIATPIGLMVIDIFLGLITLAATLALFAIAVLVTRFELDADRALQSGRAALDDSIDDLLLGFAEVRLNAKRRVALVTDLKGQLVATTRSRARLTFMTGGLYALCCFAHLIILLAVVVVAANTAYALDDQFRVAAICIVLVPTIVLGRLPRVARAIRAMERIGDVIGAARTAAPAPAAPPPAPRRLERGLAITDLTFAHAPSPGREPAAIGPLTLDLRPGEACFLVGENGSGKSTALRTICGLYGPTAGTVHADGVPLTPFTDHGVFSGVFADTPVFPRLYGARSVPDAVIAAALHRVGLGHKVSVTNGKFSTVDLSKGQRKRLALVHALVENRPVLVLDEWAADQDPASRHWFYTEFLAKERASGRAILLASHDQPYFCCADHVIELPGGKRLAKGS
ncbi:MAG: ATP-binding cassette domain-containing protein [Pseudomonadota bacterium]